MNTLASLLSWIVSQLQAWSGAADVRVIETGSFSDDQFHLKVRARLKDPFHFQVRYYKNHEHLDYAYQLFTDVPVLRWDNKEDAGEVDTAPHHFHNENNEITASPLNGDPVHDWPIVRSAVDNFIDDQNKPTDRIDALKF